MHRSILATIGELYADKAPAIVMDATPASILRAAMRRLSRRWLGNFDRLSTRMAEYFAKAVSERVDGEFSRLLRAHGFTVRFKMTPEQRDVMDATIGAQVALIKSIPAQHLAAVEGVVMRGVATGRDQASIVTELTEGYGVTRRRAAFITRDQNNKATAALNRTRQLGLGLEDAWWLHSAGGKTPRPEHVAFSGKTYKIAKGAYLEGKWTWPGVEINCRCVGGAVIPGFEY